MELMSWRHPSHPFGIFLCLTALAGYILVELGVYKYKSTSDQECWSSESRFFPQACRRSTVRECSFTHAC